MSINQSIHGFERLPREICWEIASNLPFADVFCLRLACKYLGRNITMVWLRENIGPDWRRLSDLFREGTNYVYNSKDIRSSNDDDHGLAQRMNFRTITQLDARYNLRITGSILRAMTLYCPYLSSINLSGCTQLNHSDLSYLMRHCTDALQKIVPPDHLLEFSANRRFGLIEERDRDAKGAIVRGPTYLCRRS